MKAVHGSKVKVTYIMLLNSMLSTFSSFAFFAVHEGESTMWLIQVCVNWQWYY